ncbi:hypothetical protein C8J57DRAFT_1612136 [Mycena rebaudengoi]|nr:hypothetical protein C8J57DRAFT_1612136 [Mycena rebaudengoi]
MATRQLETLKPPSDWYQTVKLSRSEQLAKTLLSFADQYGIDVQFLRDIVHPEYLSDEISEPEDETREAKAAWKVRLAAAAGISLSPAVLERTQILEVLVPPWRTEMYRNIIHALSKCWYESLSDKQKEAIKYHRVYTDRVSTRIPLYAPFDFGFSQEWVKQQATDSEMWRILKDWGKYPEPVDLVLLEASRDGVVSEVQ